MTCKCGQPIKPCPVTLGPEFRMLCRGYVHTATSEHICRRREGIAEPEGENR